ncbi:MAG: T9SS type A sorting domain-containing protein [Gemmatimonadaceae bacterium]|nr:T9SS type A sorting domain-containing protein [Chitinophagaceae bacterium]
MKDSLPVLASHLSVTLKEGGKAIVRWECVDGADESFFAVERSNNGIDFSVIGIIKSAGGVWGEFSDDSPFRGRSYYRIRSSCGQRVFYSETVQTVISGDVSCKFYPNPVDKALIVRTEFDVDIVIVDKYGKPVLNTHLSAGLRVVDVSTLNPGLYIITLYQKEINRQITEKLIKK